MSVESMQVSADPQNRWSRQWVFVLAVAGATAGLGNVWKFPHLLSDNGGMQFLLMYLACLLLLGIPMMMAELALGRAGQGSPIRAFSHAIASNTTSRHWRVIAIFSLVTSFLVFAFYSVISGWVLSYFFSAAAGEFAEAGSEQLESVFITLLSDPVSLTVWHTLFMALVCTVLFKGVRGLDQATRVLMPLLLALLLMLLGVVLATGNLNLALESLFYWPDRSASSSDWLTALSHAFFTLSIGMGVLLAYGRYAPDKLDLGQSVITIVIVDTLIGLLFGIVTYGLITTNGELAEKGPGLLFISMPFAFDNMSNGNGLAAGFFFAVIIVVWTSTVALLEPLVQALEEVLPCSRVKAIWIIGLAVWGLGVLTLLSFNELQSWRIQQMTIFDLLDFISAQILLPMASLLLVFFVGWQLKPSYMQQAMATSAWIYTSWLVLIRFGVPVLLLLVVSTSLQSRF